MIPVCCGSVVPAVELESSRSQRNCLVNAVVGDVHDPEQFDPYAEKKNYKPVPGFHRITTRDISRASRAIADG